MLKLWTDMERAVKSTAAGRSDCVDIGEYRALPDGRNEAVFFLKPELAVPEQVNFEALAALMDGSLTNFKVEIVAVRVMGGKYLEDNNIMARHYGAINSVSRLGIQALTSTAREELARCFKSEGSEELTVLGGHQVLDWAAGRIDAEGLESLWEKTTGQKRLAPGVYANSFSLFGQDLVILNGFHPQQLDYFISAGKSIVVMVVRSESPWKILRTQLIGATDPNKAEHGSIRKLLLENASALGLTSISKGKNGVHLSAGPLEAFFEIDRFFGSTGEFWSHSSLAAAAAEAGLSNDTLQGLSSNPLGLFGRGEQSAFDATEELDMREVIDLMKIEFGVGQETKSASSPQTQG